ncbi:uncharacterized protein ACIBXB_000519 isoform 1-T1 [Morphnus guianensis]
MSDGEKPEKTPLKPLPGTLAVIWGGLILRPCQHCQAVPKNLLSPTSFQPRRHAPGDQGTGRATYQLPVARRRAVSPGAIYGKAAAKPGSPRAFDAPLNAGNLQGKRNSGPWAVCFTGCAVCPGSGPTPTNQLLWDFTCSSPPSVSWISLSHL